MIKKTSQKQVSPKSCFEKFRNFTGTPFFINNPFLTLDPKIVEAFLKIRSKKLFSNCLVDGLLTSVSIFKHSERRHSLLQGHLDYVMHTMMKLGTVLSFLKKIQKI